MKKHLFNLIRLLLLLAIGIFVYIAGILIINSVQNYSPEDTIIPVSMSNSLQPVEEKGILSILSWNIGYAGLGENADFFYDGGKMVRPPREDYDRYHQGILKQISELDSIDFIILQEVDTFSRRSYGINQFKEFQNTLTSHSGIFVKNYDVLYVPLPFLNPMGRVVSGLSLFSAYRIQESSQIVFPESFAWPNGLFMPDRCFIHAIFTLSSGKSLHIINTHNSAFDDGSLRNSQLEILYDIMLGAYENGDYVIAGGDWNMNPAGYSNTTFISGDPAFGLSDIAAVEGPEKNWQLAFNTLYPTNRDVSTKYIPGTSIATIIDYFVCSPNIQVHEVKCLYDGFKYSDHHPVILRFELK